MNIIIARDNQTFGPYTRDQVEELVVQGELSSEDLSSWEGGKDWCPLAELLSSSPEPEQEDGIEEIANDDDFDHEKMKQWEDVFVDDEEGFEDDDQFVDETENQDDFTPLLPAQSTVSLSPEIPHERVVPPPAAAPPLAPIDTSSFVDESIHENQLPPPPPPPPPASATNTTPPSPENRDESKPQAREKAPPDRPSPITPRSKKIRGLNSRQTVIVVKSSSIFSKLYTISLIFLILSVLSYLVAFVLVTVWPDDVGPKLQRVGIPLVIFGYEGPSSNMPAPSLEPSSPGASDSSHSDAEKSNAGMK
jgi:hypothetical protein